MDENKNPMQEPGQNPPPPASQPLPWKPNTYTPPPLLTFPMEKRELILALVTLLFSLLLCNSLIYAGLNLGFALGTIGLIGSGFFYLRSHGHVPSLYCAGVFLLCVVILAAFPRSDDTALKALVIPVLLVIPSLCLCLMAGRSRYSSDGICSLLDGPITLFGLGFGQMGETARGIRDAFRSTGRLGKTGGAVLLGLAIALPLLLILIPLLMSADAAFEGLLDLLPEFRWQEFLNTVLWGAGLAYVLYTRSAALQHLPKTDHIRSPRKGLGSITVNTVLITVVLVYTAYLLSQLAYFVGGFSGILPQDYTLAEYARRGFFEMGWLCAINLSIIALAIGLVTAKQQPSLLTRLLCLFLGLVTLFLVATASAKMLLYIGSYGLTRLRVLTEVFMIWLALTTVVICIWLFRPKLGYMKPVLLAALILCAGLLWVDVDTQVAKYNVRAYQSGKLETVDVSHLGILNLGAVPYLAELAEDSDPEIAQMAKDVLTRHARYYLQEEPDFRSWNYAASRAMEILRQYTPGK